MVQAMYTAYGSTPNGTAATADVTTTTTDTTAGRLLKVGDFGVGVNTGLSIPSGDYNQATVAGRYVGAGASAVNAPSSLAAYGTLQVARGGGYVSQYATFGSAASGLKVEFRGSNNGTTWSPWQEIYHTGSTFDGIKFPATQVPSADANTLDDYEEGTFTPSFSFSGAAVGAIYSSVYNRGWYTKVGNLVTLKMSLVVLDEGTSVGDLRVYIPFVSSQNGAATSWSVHTNKINSANTMLFGNFALGYLEAYSTVASTTVGRSQITDVDVGAGAGFAITVVGSYQI